MKDRVVVFDLDGTLVEKEYLRAGLDSDNWDWLVFMKSMEGPRVIEETSDALLYHPDQQNIILTARPSFLRTATKVMLQELGLLPDRLIMMTDEESRQSLAFPDYFIEQHVRFKRRVLEGLMVEFDIEMCYEDENYHLETLEDLGLDYIQVTGEIR